MRAVCTTTSWNYPGQKKTATTIMHKIRTLFLSWDIEKSSLIALRCAATREVLVAASRATVPINLLIMLILRDKNSVLILCIIVVAVFLSRDQHR